MTRRALFGVLAAPLLPATEAVIPPGLECAHCAERPEGAEGTIWCAECLAWYRNAYSVEWIRLNPSRGDAVVSLEGVRVEVTNVLECESGTLVWFTRTVPGKGSQDRVMWAHQWAELAGWDVARLA